MGWTKWLFSEQLTDAVGLGRWNWKQGHPSPLRQWFIFPLFQISPYFRKNFETPWKFFKISPFLKNVYIFICQNFWWPFFSHWLTILNFPLFSLFQQHFPLFWENYYSPPLLQISLWFRTIYVFFTYFKCFSFHHDALMHHTMHVLDALIGSVL